MSPKGSKIPPAFRDQDDFYNKYFATTMCMVVNKDRLAQKNLPMPTTWEDLIKPVYPKEISLPSPLKSGTGGAILTTFVDAFGWPFVENLNENVYQYSDGGSGGAAQLAGAGEVAIGLTFDTTCFETKAAGKPVEIVYGRITPNVTEGGEPRHRRPEPGRGEDLPRLHGERRRRCRARQGGRRHGGARPRPGRPRRSRCGRCAARWT